jgi:hypothetical protein
MIPPSISLSAMHLKFFISLLGLSSLTSTHPRIPTPKSPVRPPRLLWEKCRHFICLGNEEHHTKFASYEGELNSVFSVQLQFFSSIGRTGTYSKASGINNTQTTSQSYDGHKLRFETIQNQERKNTNDCRQRECAESGPNT